MRTEGKASGHITTRREPARHPIYGDASPQRDGQGSRGPRGRWRGGRGQGRGNEGGGQGGHGGVVEEEGRGQWHGEGADHGVADLQRQQGVHPEAGQGDGRVQLGWAGAGTAHPSLCWEGPYNFLLTLTLLKTSDAFWKTSQSLPQGENETNHEENGQKKSGVFSAGSLWRFFLLTPPGEGVWTKKSVVGQCLN